MQWSSADGLLQTLRGRLRSVFSHSTLLEGWRGILKRVKKNSENDHFRTLTLIFVVVFTGVIGFAMVVSSQWLQVSESLPSPALHHRFTAAMFSSCEQSPLWRQIPGKCKKVHQFRLLLPLLYRALQSSAAKGVNASPRSETTRQDACRCRIVTLCFPRAHVEQFTSVAASRWISSFHCVDVQRSVP